MRLTRVLTVVLAAATVSVALAAPAAAEAYIYPPTSYVAPIYDPLRPIRPLVDASVSLEELVNIGAVAVDVSPLVNAVYLDPNIDMVSPTVKITKLLDNNSSISSYCTYTRTGAGVGSSGGSVDFTVVAEATAYGRYKGVEIIATGVACTLYKPDMTISEGPIFAPGSVSALTKSRSSYDARGGVVCVQAWAQLRAVPAGESSSVKTTGLSCS